MGDKEDKNKSELKDVPQVLRAVGYISPNYPNEREKRRNNRIDFIKHLLYHIAAALVAIPILIVVMTQGYFTLTGTATKILFAAALLFWESGMGCAAYLSRKDQAAFQGKLSWMFAALVGYILYLI